MYRMNTAADAKKVDARLVPSKEEYDLKIQKDRIYELIKQSKLQTKDDILKYGALPDGNVDQGSIEFAEIVEKGVNGHKVHVYDVERSGEPVASAVVTELGRIEGYPTLKEKYTASDVIIYPQFDKYDYPLAKDGNYFIAFDPNSSNQDIAAFSRDVYRITNTKNEEDLYNKLVITEWQDIIKASFNVGRPEDDYIDIIYDQNLGTFDLRAIAFVAKLKYHDPAKLTNPNFQDNRVFIGFRNEYYNEPVGRLSRLANDAYIFLTRLSKIPEIEQAVPLLEEITPNVNKIAKGNDIKEAELIQKMASETAKLIKAEEDKAELIQKMASETVKLIKAEENKTILTPHVSVGIIAVMTILFIGAIVLAKTEKKKKSKS